MTSSVVFTIIVMGVATLFQAKLVLSDESTSEYTLFGKEVRGNHWTTSKHKYGIPLLTRSTEVAFPDVIMFNHVCVSTILIFNHYVGFHGRQSNLRI